MAKTYKPNGYTSVAPYLIVNGAEKTIQFLEKVFGAQRLRRYEREKGVIMHAEVRIDDTVVMLADSTDTYAMTPTHVHIYVPDVDETYRKAIEAGAQSVQEPVQKDDEDKRGGFRDAGGTIWWIGTQIG